MHIFTFSSMILIGFDKQSRLTIDCFCFFFNFFCTDFLECLIILCSPSSGMQKAPSSGFKIHFKIFLQHFFSLFLRYLRNKVEILGLIKLFYSNGFRVFHLSLRLLRPKTRRRARWGTPSPAVQPPNSAYQRDADRGHHPSGGIHPILGKVLAGQNVSTHRR